MLVVLVGYDDHKGFIIHLLIDGNAAIDLTLCLDTLNGKAQEPYYI